MGNFQSVEVGEELTVSSSQSKDCQNMQEEGGGEGWGGGGGEECGGVGVMGGGVYSKITVIVITLKGILKNNTNNYHIEKYKLRSVQSPHCTVNCLQHAHSSGLGAIMCKSPATH